MVRNHGQVLFLVVFLASTGPLMALETSDRITVLTEDHGYFPCSDCHESQETIHQPRILVEEHDVPLRWEDEDGVVRLVSFGRHLAISDLLGREESLDLETDNLARIGQRVRIEDYMLEYGLAETDSVWTLVHGGGNLWCLDCHNADDRDYLVKLNGELLTFNQSHLLCGECHGAKLRDWHQGIHGKTTGSWDPANDELGVSRRWLCVECHSPHRPAFPAHQPLAGPVPRIGGHRPDPAGDDPHQEAGH